MIILFKTTDSTEEVKNGLKNADIYLYKDGTRFQRNEYEILCYFFFRRIGYEH